MREALQFAAVSCKGVARGNNEDSYTSYVHESGYPAVFVVADGMGGHQHGEIASRLACDYVSKRLSEDLGQVNQADRIEHLLRDTVQKANIKVYLASLTSSHNNGMGCTLTIAVFFETSVYIAHIGDSRCYLLRSGVLELLSRDHTLIQEMLDAGTLSEEESFNHPQRHVLTQALGAPEYLRPEIQHLDLKKHDRYILCSDGLHGFVDDFQISETIRISANAEDCCRKLIKTSLERGGSDDLTVISVFA